MNLFQVDIEQSRLILRRFAQVRALLVLIVGFFCAVLHFGGESPTDLGTAYLLAIFFVALVESLLVLVILRTSFRPTARFSFVLLISDMVLISAVVALTGGGRSAFAFLYIAVILSTSLLLELNWSLLVAAISSCLFLGMAYLSQSGIVSAASVFRGLSESSRTGGMWAHVGMTVLAFYLTAFLSGYLSRRIGMLRTIQGNILNSFSSGFLSVDLEHRVTFINEAAAGLLRRSRSKCIGKDVSAVFPVTQGGENPLKQAVAGAEQCRGREVSVSRGYGIDIPVGVTASSLKNSDGQFVGAVASFVDLTEMKRMEEKLRRADRLAAMGEMSASLAHEIRNPVASIRGAVQEMSDNLTLAGTNERLMHIAIKESDQLSRVIASFLEFVDTSAPEKDSFSVDRLIEEALHDMEERAARIDDMHVQMDCPQSVGNVIGERDRIKNALKHIVQNGIEAMPEGGRLSVSARLSHKGDSQNGNGGNGGERVIIRISDTGGGISADQADKVFDAFYTTKPQGIGLGMAIAHKVIGGNGGTIDLESVQGQGTTVIVALPRGT
jgi:two-component system sensor histidine kinase PilS (NtrC family)